MKTRSPIQVDAARLRPTNPEGAAAVDTHWGVHWPVAQVRPGPQELSQPPQFAASLFGFTHAVPQRIEGGVQVGRTQLFELHTLPPLQSASLQHSKHPCCPQQRPPPAHGAENTQVPAELQVSVEHWSPSLQSSALQHWRQLVPQSFGVLAAHAHAELAQIAPGLQALGQLPQ